MYMFQVFSMLYQVHDVTSGSAWTQGEHRQGHYSQVKTRVVDYGVIFAIKTPVSVRA